MMYIFQFFYKLTVALSNLKTFVAIWHLLKLKNARDF